MCGNLASRWTRNYTHTVTSDLSIYFTNTINVHSQSKILCHYVFRFNIYQPIFRTISLVHCPDNNSKIMRKQISHNTSNALPYYHIMYILTLVSLVRSSAKIWDKKRILKIDVQMYSQWLNRTLISVDQSVSVHVKFAMALRPNFTAFNINLVSLELSYGKASHNNIDSNITACYSNSIICQWHQWPKSEQQK